VFVAMMIVGLIFAPTLGGAIFWAVMVAVGLFIVYLILRRFYLRLVGRRGGRR